MIKTKRSPEDIYFSFIDLSIFMKMNTILFFGFLRFVVYSEQNYIAIAIFARQRNV